MPSSDARHYARFIPSEEVGEVTQWTFGTVTAEGVQTPSIEAELPAMAAPSVEELTAQLQQVHDEAHAQGLAQGLAQGMEQGRQQASLEWQQRLDDYIAHQGQQAAERLQALHQSFAQALDALQQQLAQQVLQLACELARQVVRRELATDPQALLPVVREAVEQLLADGRPALVRLHPADKEALGPALQAAFAQASGVQWLADASVPAGGCQVESGGTVIDGRLETRWERAIAALGLESAWQTSPSTARPTATPSAPSSAAPADTPANTSANTSANTPAAGRSAPQAMEAAHGD